MSDSDFGISLDFGGVRSIQGGGQPLPNGVYRFLISDAAIENTRAGTGRGIVVHPVVAEGEFEGRPFKKDFWNIPSSVDLTPQKYESAMGFLRGKLESVYGTLPEQFKLNVKDMVGRDFAAVVVIKEDPTYGMQNNIVTYLPKGTDVSKVVVPKGIQQAVTQNGSPAPAAAAPAAPGRFKI